MPAYGDRVEYDLTDGTTVVGTIISAGDEDRIGSAHGIELDTDRNEELHWIGTGFVRPSTR